LALSNLLIFSYFDFESDLLDEQPSFAQSTSKPMTRAVALTLLSIQLLTAVVATGSFNVTWILIPMGLTLVSLLLFQDYFKVGEKYRIWGDLIFLYPMIWLFLKWA
jgi:hypothetical protein